MNEDFWDPEIRTLDHFGMLNVKTDRELDRDDIRETSVEWIPGFEGLLYNLSEASGDENTKLERNGDKRQIYGPAEYIETEMKDLELGYGFSFGTDDDFGSVAAFYDPYDPETVEEGQQEMMVPTTFVHYLPGESESVLYIQDLGSRQLQKH